MIDEARQVYGRCPECGADLVVRINRERVEYLGCRRSPRCSYTRTMPPAVQMVRAGVEMIPGLGWGNL